MKRMYLKCNSDDVSEIVSEYLSESKGLSNFTAKTDSYGKGDNWRIIIAAGENDIGILDYDLEELDGRLPFTGENGLKKGDRIFFKLNFSDASKIVLRDLQAALGLEKCSSRIRMFGEDYYYRVLIVIGDKGDSEINKIDMKNAFNKARYAGTHPDMERFLDNL